MIIVSKIVFVLAVCSVEWICSNGHREEFYRHQPEDATSSVRLKARKAIATSQRQNQAPPAGRVLVLPANNQFQDAIDGSHMMKQHPQFAHLSKVVMNSQEANNFDNSWAEAGRLYEAPDAASMAGNNRSLELAHHQITTKHWMSGQAESGAATMNLPSQANQFNGRSNLASRTSLESLTTTTYATPSTTDQSNSIVQMTSSPRSASLGTSEADFRYSQMMRSSNSEDLARASSSSSSLPSQSGSRVELHNHIVYEGPATAPPVAGDYYGPTDTPVASTNSEPTSNAWWAIGLGHEFDRASNLSADDYLDYCFQSRLLDEHQRALCRMHPKIMAIVARGLKIAFDECQTRFSNSRWNCSLLLLEDSSDSLELPGGKRQVFGELMRHSNRERSFLNAIVAAGLAHAMTKACSANELPEECSCDKVIRLKQKKDSPEWTACSEDIDFGARFSHDFTDGKPLNSDTSFMVDSHNYGVGRQVFKSNTDLTCSCGDSGPCQIKRCWKQVGPFSNIGDILLERYESATHVQTSLHDPRKLRPVRRGLRRPKRKDLIFTEESPDYCSPDSRLGILGTQNRQCNSTTSGPNSCSNLCCDRGYQVVVEDIEEDCNCKFVWCCQLKCDKCVRHLTSEICN